MFIGVVVINIIVLISLLKRKWKTTSNTISNLKESLFYEVFLFHIRNRQLFTTLFMGHILIHLRTGKGLHVVSWSFANIADIFVDRNAVLDHSVFT